MQRSIQSSGRLLQEWCWEGSPLSAQLSTPVGSIIRSFPPPLFKCHLCKSGWCVNSALTAWIKSETLADVFSLYPPLMRCSVVLCPSSIGPWLRAAEQRVRWGHSDSACGWWHRCGLVTTSALRVDETSSELFASSLPLWLVWPWCICGRGCVGTGRKRSG